MATAVGTYQVTVRPPVAVDVATVGQLIDDITAACKLHPRRLVVDFADVVFCDSTAVTALEHATQDLLADGCRLEVHHPTAMLLRMVAAFGVWDQVGLSLPD